MTTKHAHPRLGFIGLGWIGRMRLRAAVDSGVAEVACLADNAADAISEAKLLAPGALVARSLDEMLEARLDAVVIATPSALHAAQATRALEAGLPVYCQKPLARSAAEAKAVVDVARRRNLLLSVDFCYRHTRAGRAVAELVQSGRLGSIYAASLVFHNGYGPDKPWVCDASLSGGGCLMELGIHLVDFAVWALAAEGVLVEAACVFSGGKPLQSRAHTEDYASASLRFGPRGPVAQLSCSWRASVGADAQIESTFLGTRGAASFRNVGGSFYDFVADHHEGTRSTRLCEPPDDWGGRGLCEFIEALAHGASQFRDGAGYVKASRAVDDIYATARKTWPTRERAGARMKAV